VLSPAGVASMISPRRLVLALVLALGSLAAPTSVRADEAENYQLLQAMPRERRLALAENLERFDKLDRAEQAAIRNLDAEIARKDPVEQARYRALLRRYHLWVNGLTDDQKKELKEAPTAEARFAAARKFRAKDAQTSHSGPRLAGIRTGDFGLLGPIEAAHLLKVWNKLTPAKKAEIEKQHERGRLFAAIRAETKAVGVRRDPFPTDHEADFISRIEGDPDLKKVLGPFARSADSAQKKNDAAQKKAESARRWFEHPFAEFLYFEENRPHAVSQKNLERFSAACPAWLHSMTDPLSADDARQYLTILYRRLYPPPNEMPADPKPTQGPASPPASPRPAAKKASNSGPV
jgi:hypothetical protein